MPTPPPVDPDVRAALELLGPAPSLTPDRIAERRAGLLALRPSDADLSGDGAFEVTEHTAPGPAGSPGVPVLVCRPTTATATAAATAATVTAAATTRLPVVLYLHGGGMVVGGNRQGVDQPLAWSRELGLLVVSAEYRLAPEHPHPAPVEDAYAALLWTHRHAARLGGDPARIVVAGDSAGGGLAAAVALLARDRRGPALLGQLLLSPMLDDRNDSVSVRQTDGLGGWDRVSNETGWTALLGTARGTDAVSPYAAPARATDLAGLPPALLEAGSAEAFRDEVVAYAAALWAAGGEAELHVWPGGVHGFTALAPDAPLSRAATAARLTWLRRLLRP